MFTTPAPIDSQTVNSLIQAGAVGVLFMVAFAVVLWIWTHRNVKPVDPTIGLNIALSAFAKMIDDDRELRKEENRASLKQNKELQEAYIESISANADATNRIADNQDRLTALEAANHLTLSGDTNLIKTAVVQMAEIGSKPLQGLVETAARIEGVLDQIVKSLIPSNEIKHMHEKEIQDFQAALDALRADVMIIATSMQNRIDEKRITGTTQSVPSPSSS